MKYLLSILILLLSLNSYSQQEKLYDSFVHDFTNALDKRFTEEDLNKMFRKYDEILPPHTGTTQLSAALKGHSISIYPLSGFKNQALYINNIKDLLNSQNPNQRILAYLVIASSDDTSKENVLLEKIKSEHARGNLIWSGMALLYLGCNQTTPLFDFLVKNEDFGDAHMLPLYVMLNKDSLQQTAYNRISSNNIKAKVLAAQILSVTPPNAKTEELLKQAVKTWDINIKGYAIYSIKELQIGDLLESFKPLVDNPKTRNIALQALANSPTETDRGYLYELVNKQQDTIPEELLNCFYKSKNEQNVQYWLKLLYTKPIHANYLFFVFNQPLIHSNIILSDLQNALTSIKNPKILAELVRALEGRMDDKSLDIMINFLNNEDSTVRYWTAETLKDNSSPKAKTPQVEALINKDLKDE
ncbi:MAG TPA: HEAT repeat domain-containing protein [Mucilaginibacter sp.]|jgi:hypothetical protein|nr:HEAT repeat domain-containing protein [Mucilaginibacter sp.]